MTRVEYVKTFDASILTKEDIDALSYLQTYGRKQGICFGNHDEMVCNYIFENATY